MDHQRTKGRELASIFVAKANLHAHADGDVSALTEVVFYFRTEDDALDEGPSVTCKFAFPARSIDGSTVYTTALKRAAAMLRRIASISDDELRETWQSTLLNVEA